MDGYVGYGVKTSRSLEGGGGGGLRLGKEGGRLG